MVYGKAKKIYKKEVKYVNKVLKAPEKLPGKVIPKPISIGKALKSIGKKKV